MPIHPSDCPLEPITRLLGGKWKVRILWAVYQAGRIRFNKLKQDVGGITDLSLTKCLKEFVDNDIISRQQFMEVPPHVEYSLTENGQNLIAALLSLRQWSRAQDE